MSWLCGVCYPGGAAPAPYRMGTCHKCGQWCALAHHDSEKEETMNDVDQLKARILNLRIQMLDTQRQLKALVAKPTWSKLSGEEVRISDMDDKYLLNTAMVCLRHDIRYGWTATRMRSFYYITREVARRKLHSRLRDMMGSVAGAK